MAQIIQIKRRIPGTGAPATLAAGEPATSISAGGVADLFIGDGSAVRTLVSSTRQVELTGDQTITGEKTIDVTDLKITGGADGDLLTTDGNGVLDWVAPTKGVESGTTAPTSPDDGDLWFNTTTQQLMVYNGTAWRIATHSTVAAAAPTTPAPQDGDTWYDTTNGLLMVRVAGAWEPATDTSAGLVSVNVDAPLTGTGTSSSALGVTMATTAQINTGTDDVYPIDSAGLRTQTGAAVSTLDTTAKTIVPAINELFGDIGTLQDQLGAITGALRFVGNFDADQSEVVSAATGTLTVGANLPAAAAGNEGWYVIVTEAGTPSAPAPTEAMQVGDWIVSNGTAWIHVPLYHAAVTAGNVALSPVVNSWNNVQAAIAGLYTLSGTALETVAVDGVSIVGDGTSGDPLEVGTVDGGTF